MADIAYKPTSEYKEQYNTAITRENWQYGLLMYGQRKNFCEQDSGVFSRTPYTVPEGKTFFLTSVALKKDGGGGGGYSYAFLTIGAIASGDYLLMLGANLAGYTDANLNPTIPLKLTSGERLVFTGTGSGNATLAVWGIEIDSALLQNLI